MPTPITHTSRFAMPANLAAGRVRRQAVRTRHQVVPLLRPDDRRERPRRLRRLVEGPQRESPPPDVVPAPVLEPDRGDDPRALEPEGLVQADAGSVRERDDADRRVEPLEPQRLE